MAHARANVTGLMAARIPFVPQIENHHQFTSIPQQKNRHRLLFLGDFGRGGDRRHHLGHEIGHLVLGLLGLRGVFAHSHDAT
jgi:hypothetical protein